ncbi:hypothetical protein [Kitasatospora sp. NPDC085879]|uniref:hypothetical protein n=1 Tax=Kitasatospora sp. NPDC085879 TaxID=3154769 RepID=UPI00343600EB
MTDARRTVGDGPKRAAVLAPAMPVWDGGAFLGPVTGLLTAAGYRVTVYDTLSADRPDFTAAADHWAAELAADGRPDLIAGAALGGATALDLLARPAFRGTPALLISAPMRADAELDERLGAISVLAAAGDLGAALALLEHRVAPATGVGEPPRTTPVPAPATPGSTRLARGLPLLRGLDLGAAEPRLDGPLLHLYGEHSQLVTGRHGVPPRPPHRHSTPVPGAGMRPQADNPPFTAAAVGRFLEELAA